MAALATARLQVGINRMPLVGIRQSDDMVRMP